MKMLGPTTILTPKVADIHYDDLENLFRLRITFQVETPLGNFERELVLTGAALAAILTELVNVWTSGAPALGVDGLNYHVGDFAAFGADMAARTFLPEALVTPPTPPASDNTTDPDWGSYVGSEDSWGATLTP
jgi:hypothetical protein